MSIIRIKELLNELQDAFPAGEEFDGQRDSITALRSHLAKGEITEFYSELRSQEILFFDDMRPDYAVDEEGRRPPTRHIWEEILQVLCNAYGEQ